MTNTNTSSRHRRVRRRPLLASLAAGAIATGSLVVAGAWAGPASGTGEAPAAAARAGQWTTTPTPVEKGDLTAVAALDGEQAWAVGYRLKDSTNIKNEAVALRWNGTSWKQESTLPPDSFPQALAVKSADDIWTVGASSAHWDGTAWTARAFDRDPGGRLTPDAVAIASDGKAWAVGRAVPQGIKNGVPAVQAWDGSAWRRQALPDVGKGELTSLAVVAPDDIWAAGSSFAGVGTEQTALLLHFDGTSWTRVEAPKSKEGEHRWFAGITAVSADEVWAVGGSVTGGSERPFAARWDGRKWTAVSTPDVPDGRLRAAGRSGDNTLWAVGGKGSVSVALRWDATQRRFEQAPDPSLVIRGLATVPHTADLWTVGIAKKGDLIPAAARFKG
ncbi:hypothetical protein [Streptomyces sp. NPDC002187]|uniref:hypothetical protein n=1 Tax=Streptomyces sp. NPDC002187 TaxID=3364637 RepID=UPI0036BFAABF